MTASPFQGRPAGTRPAPTSSVSTPAPTLSTPTPPSAPIPSHAQVPSSPVLPSTLLSVKPLHHNLNHNPFTFGSTSSATSTLPYICKAESIGSVSTDFLDSITFNQMTLSPPVSPSPAVQNKVKGKSRVNDLPVPPPHLSIPCPSPSPLTPPIHKARKGGNKSLRIQPSCWAIALSASLLMTRHLFKWLRRSHLERLSNTNCSIPSYLLDRIPKHGFRFIDGVLAGEQCCE
jgi:hypothetical protein